MRDRPINRDWRQWLGFILISISFLSSSRAALRLLRWLPLALIGLSWAAAAQTSFVVTDETTRYDVTPIAEYIEDPTLAMDLHEAMAPENEGRYRIAHRNGDINFGFSSSAYWLRFKVQPDANAPRDWLLEIPYPPLDRAEIYIPDEWGNYGLLVLGDRQSFDTRPFPNRNLVAPLQLQPQVPQIIYMRVTSVGPIHVPMTLWQPTAYLEADETTLSLLVLYMGMLLALTLYNLMLYFSIKQRAYLAYAGFGAAMCFAQASYSGLAFQYFWPTWPTWAHHSVLVSFSLVGMLGCAFTRTFFNLPITLPKRKRRNTILLIGFLLSIASNLISYKLSGHITAVLCIIGGVEMITLGIIALREDLAGARYFLTAWSLLAVGIIVFSMQVLGVIPANMATAHALQFGSGAEMLLLALALADRINTMRREKETAQSQALRAQRELVIAMQEHELDLESRIEQRTLELELANRQLRENEKHLQEMVHHDPLTGLANRVLLYDRIQHGLVKNRRDGGLLAVLLIDLDRFKPINDRYGHAVGDQLLIAIAQRFTASVRESDTVARLGGDEFVVLLERLPNEETLKRIIRKLEDEAVRPFEIQGFNLYVSASIGFALYPDHGSDAQSLLAHADAAMYAVKPKRLGAQNDPHITITQAG